MTDPTQINIGKMVFPKEKRKEKAEFREEEVLRLNQEKSDDESTKSEEREEKITKHLKMLRKKRFDSKLMNKILFGDPNVDSDEVSGSDAEAFGSTNALSDGDAGSHKRCS